uniref:Uncharacterized protein n=1 Tax=Schizaphis graminum TaxID=13262 RepID=A0A2S2PM11_SCHGA
MRPGLGIVVFFHPSFTRLRFISIYFSFYVLARHNTRVYIKFGTLIFLDTIAKYFTIFNPHVIPTAFVVLVFYIIQTAAVDYSAYALIVELIVLQTRAKIDIIL